MLGFEVLKKLADGRAAEAFLARQQGTEERVVVEILRPELPPDLGRLFVDEAAVLRALEHPNLVRRAQIGRTADGRPFVVTEPLEGESLTQMLWSVGSLEPEEVVRVAIPLCDALAYLHAGDRVHGAVTADNVYLRGGLGAHHPKLIDYRLALLWGSNGEAIAGGTLRPEYQAPECLAGEKADARADIYAMGILIYEALTGFPPFTGATAEEVLRHQRSGLPPLPASCERLSRIVQRCLHLERLERYASAGELGDALAREVDGAERATPVPAIAASRRKDGEAGLIANPGRRAVHAPTAPRFSRRGARRKSYAAVAVVALAAIGTGWLSHKRPMLAARAPGSGQLPPFSRAIANAPAAPSAKAPAPEAVRLQVTSEPPGALVVWATSGEALGRTPLSTSVPRQQDQSTVHFELPGFRRASRTIRLDADASIHAKLKSAAAPVRKKYARRRHPAD